MSDFSGDAGFPAPPPPPPNITPPPGYVSYGGGNTGAFGNFQPIGGVAKAIRVLLIIIIPLLAITAFLLFNVKDKADDFVNGGSLTDYEDALAPYGLLSLLVGVVTLSIFVLTVIWMFRMAKNQVAMNRNGTWGPAWAIAGWFLPPCVLFVIPYLMLRDLWKASDPNSGPDWKKNPIGPIVHVWWVLYGLIPLAFISVTVGNFQFNADANDTDTAQDIVDGFGVNLGSSIVQIGAAVAFLLLVAQLTARHKQTTNEG